MQYTAVFEFEEGNEPLISRRAKWLGGKLISVQFNNALDELESLRDRLEELEQLHLTDYE